MYRIRGIIHHIFYSSQQHALGYFSNVLTHRALIYCIVVCSTWWKIIGIIIFPYLLGGSLYDTPHLPCLSMLSNSTCARDVWWLPTASEVSQKPCGVRGAVHMSVLWMKRRIKWWSVSIHQRMGSIKNTNVCKICQWSYNALLLRMHSIWYSLFNTNILSSQLKQVSTLVNWLMQDPA